MIYNNIIKKKGIISLKLILSSVTEILKYNRCETNINERERSKIFLKDKKLKINIGGALAMYELERYTRVETLIVATICLQLIQNRYMFRSFTVLRCSHQHCVQPVASDVEVVGYL